MILSSCLGALVGEWKKFYRRLTQTYADNTVFFTWAIRLRLKATTGQALPRQKMHAFQAQAPMVSRLSGIDVFAPAGRGGKCPRLSSEQLVGSSSKSEARREWAANK